LIEAHEEERTWIARELHDDINQRLALSAVKLGALARECPIPPEVRNRTDDIREQIASLGKDIQALAHRLHSSKLEYLGLESAAASFCRELSEQHKIKIDFCADGVPSDLSKEVSLCFFRVLQEALQNAVKHSGSEQFEVKLYRSANDIHLRVSDSGVGFDSEVAMRSRGLGITSMRERLKLVDGQLSIDSKPQQGTTIHARAPLGTKKRAASQSRC
jgi:signal transduction histidine kinase